MKLKGKKAVYIRNKFLLFHLELLFSGIEIDTSVVPSRPNCVVNTEEHNHVLAVKRLAGKEALNSNQFTLHQSP